MSLHWALLTSLSFMQSGAVSPREMADLSGPALIRAFHASRDIYDDSKLNEVVNTYIRDAKAWDRHRLEQEFQVMWRAARNTEGELLQAAFFGTATSLFVLNVQGAELAKEQLAAVLDAVETAPGLSQVGIAQNLSRVRMRGVSEAQLDRMARLAARVEPFAGEFLVTAASRMDAGVPSLLHALTRLLDAHISGAPAASESGKLLAYINAISAEGTGSPDALLFLERLAASGHPVWDKAAVTAIRNSVSKNPSLARSILDRVERHPVAPDPPDPKRQQ